MGGGMQAVILAGLALNFLTMILGGLTFLWAVHRTLLRYDRRATRLESDVRQLMIAQGIKPRADFSE